MHVWYGQNKITGKDTRLRNIHKEKERVQETNEFTSNPCG